MTAVNQLPNGGESQEDESIVSAGPDTVKPVSGPGQEFASKRSGMRRFVLAAAAALAIPLAASCSSGPEDSGQAEANGAPISPITNDIHQVGSSKLLENSDSLEKRSVDFWLNGHEWRFSGQYVTPFLLKVYVDGKEVAEEVVETGDFDVQGASGTAAVKAEIKCFSIDDEGNPGREISISNNPKTKEMFGVPFAVNTDNL